MYKMCHEKIYAPVEFSPPIFFTGCKVRPPRTGREAPVSWKVKVQTAGKAVPRWLINSLMSCDTVCLRTDYGYFAYKTLHLLDSSPIQLYDVQQELCDH